MSYHEESHNNGLRSYTSLPIEFIVVTLTILSFIVLAYFYPTMSGRVPLFMNLNGEVATWAEKTVFSVFRVPLLAVVTQIVCLVIKADVVQPRTTAPSLEHSELHARQRQRQTKLSAGLWDWLRLTVAFKMASESVETVFLSVPKYNFLARPAFFVTAIVTLVGLTCALIYLYRLLILAREMKKQGVLVDNPVDPRQVYFDVFYFNRSDPALFVWKYGINWANTWTWVLVACVIVYLLLVFLPE